MKTIISIMVLVWMLLTGFALIFINTEKIYRVWRIISIILLIVVVILFNLFCAFEVI